MLVGRTVTDVVNNVIVLDRDVADRPARRLADPHARSLEALGGFLLLLLFAYAISWVMACVGLLVPARRSSTTRRSSSIFPLTFIANTFVPSQALPGPLRVFADWNPVSAVTQAARELFGNTRPVRRARRPGRSSTPRSTRWSGWCIILLVFVPLTNLQYRRATSR